MSRPFNFGGTMKENIKKIIVFIIATIVLFVTMYSCGEVVNAAVPSTQIVTSHDGSWNTYGFQYNMRNKYYIVQDATGIPTSTLISPNYFFTKDNVTFFKLEGNKLITEILNYGVGAILDINPLQTFLNNYFNAIKVLDNNNSKYVQGGLYDGNDNFLGYCLNDITGCYYQDVIVDTQYTIPSEQVNNVRNYYDTLNIIPDYVTYYPISETYILNNAYSTYTQTQIDYFNTQIQNGDFFMWVNMGAGWQYKTGFSESGNVTYNNKFISYLDSVSYLINSSNSTQWTNFFTHYDAANNELLATDLITKLKANTDFGLYLSADVYNSSGVINTNKIVVDLSQMTTSNQQWGTNCKIGYVSSDSMVLPFGKEVTIYKDSTVKDDLSNGTYTQDVYYTDNFKNYSVENDNSITTYTSITDNSIDNNTDIYTDCNNDFYNYYDNGYYDTSSSSTNITNITPL